MNRESTCGEAVNLDGLPGAALIRSGIRDLLEGRTTVGACLVAIALPRLKEADFLPHDFLPCFTQGELTLYRILRNEGGDAYSRYNALLRELSSFERALSARFRKIEKS
jgi:hypothetical protein